MKIQKKEREKTKEERKIYIDASNLQSFSVKL